MMLNHSLYALSQSLNKPAVGRRGTMDDEFKKDPLEARGRYREGDSEPSVAAALKVNATTHNKRICYVLHTVYPSYLNNFEIKDKVESTFNIEVKLNSYNTRMMWLEEAGFVERII